MSAYLNQFKQKIASQMGLTKTKEDKNATKALMKIWGLSGEQPQNIFYRNRSECDSIYLPLVLSDPEIGEQVREKINSIVSKEVKQRPDLDVWDMEGIPSEKDSEKLFKSKQWTVIFEKGAGRYFVRIYKNS